MCISDFPNYDIFYPWHSPVVCGGSPVPTEKCAYRGTLLTLAHHEGSLCLDTLSPYEKPKRWLLPSPPWGQGRTETVVTCPRLHNEVRTQMVTLTSGPTLTYIWGPKWRGMHCQETDWMRVTPNVFISDCVYQHLVGWYCVDMPSCIYDPVFLISYNPEATALIIMTWSTIPWFLSLPSPERWTLLLTFVDLPGLT